MAQIIIALITPRAGEWNHRYIIPTGKTWNDTQLGETLQKLESSQGSRYGILKSATVHQQGGREGTEKLFFYFENFENLPLDSRTKCREKMENWFETQREELIQNVDWTTEGKKQVILRTELVGLCRELESLADSVRGDASRSNSQKKSFSCGGCVLMTLIVIGILSALFAYQNAYDGQGSEAIDAHSQTYSNNSQTPKVDSPVSLTDEEFVRKNWDSFEKMFEWPTNDDGQKVIEPNELEIALGQVWPEEWSEEKPKKLQDFLNPKSNKFGKVYNLCEQLKAGKQFIVFGPMEESAEKEILKGIDPVRFHKLLDECRNWQGTFFWNSDPRPYVYQAKFYYSTKDIENAKIIKEWILNGVFTESEKDQERKMKLKEYSLKDVLKYAFKEKTSNMETLISDTIPEGEVLNDSLTYKILQEIGQQK